MRFRLWAICVIAMAGCGEPPVAVKPPEPPVVTVAVVTERDFPPYVEFTGRTDAVKAVDIVPEVSGILVKINFQEGKLVKQGDVLYEIDPVPYKAVLDRAKADAASAKASLAFAEYRRRSTFPLGSPLMRIFTFMKTGRSQSIVRNRWSNRENSWFSGSLKSATRWSASPTGQR